MANPLGAWPAAFPGTVALLGLAAFAALLALPDAHAHGPDNSATGEGAGHPAQGASPLDAIAFRGPVGTLVERAPCPNGEEAVGTWVGSHEHIGHISFVESLDPGALGQGLALDSVDLWHLDEYEDPNGLDGPTQNPATGSIMMGPDGYLRGRMWSAVKDNDGPDLRITDVHETPTYCIWGARDHGGPYFFVDSTHDDPRQYATYQDLAVFYAPLFQAHYPGQEVQLAYILFMSSTWDDPDFVPDFAWTHSDAPANLTLSPISFQDQSSLSDRVGPVVPTWDFGDQTASGLTDPFHAYGRPGTYPVCLTLAPHTMPPRTTCHDVTVHNRPPACEARIDRQVPGLSGIDLASVDNDPDGQVVSREWGFGDGAGAPGTPVTHHYRREGPWIVTLTVTDDLGATCTDSLVVRATPLPNLAPWILLEGPTVGPVGAPMQLKVTAGDWDGDAVTLTPLQLPPAGRFEPATGLLTWTPPSANSWRALFVASDGLDETTESVELSGYLRVPDHDGDGVQDDGDNCPADANVGQQDADQDGAGDACQPDAAAAPPPGGAPAPEATGCPACPPDDPAPAPQDPDRDGDGVQDDADNCPAWPNPDQADLDLDHAGDACDADRDGDGLANGGPGADNCPGTPNPAQVDSDGDGVGDGCLAVQAFGRGGSAGAAPPPVSPPGPTPRPDARAAPGLPAALAIAALALAASWGRRPGRPV